MGVPRSISYVACWPSAKKTVLLGNSWISLTTTPPAAHKKLRLSSETFEFLDSFGPIHTLGNFLNRETGFETLGRNSEIWLFRFSISYEIILFIRWGCTTSLRVCLEGFLLSARFPLPAASWQLGLGEAFLAGHGRQPGNGHRKLTFLAGRCRQPGNGQPK